MSSESNDLFGLSPAGAEGVLIENTCRLKMEAALPAAVHKELAATAATVRQFRAFSSLGMSSLQRQAIREMSFADQLRAALLERHCYPLRPSMIRIPS